MGSEGWHLDVLKKWMDNTEAENAWMRPHGWRFSCRDRNDAVQGYRARYRKADLNIISFCSLSYKKPVFFLLMSNKNELVISANKETMTAMKQTLIAVALLTWLSATCQFVVSFIDFIRLRDDRIFI